MFLQKGIGFAEMPAAKKAPKRRKRTWMRSLQDQMFRIIQHCLFHLSRSSPEHKNDGPVLLIQHPDSCIGELFPSDPSVGICLMGPDSQYRIQKKDSLLGPLDQIAIVRDVASAVVMKFLIDIYQRRRDLH